MSIQIELAQDLESYSCTAPNGQVFAIPRNAQGMAQLDRWLMALHRGELLARAKPPIAPVTLPDRADQDRWLESHKVRSLGDIGL